MMLMLLLLCVFVHFVRYITERIIAMAYPGECIHCVFLEGVYSTVHTFTYHRHQSSSSLEKGGERPPRYIVCISLISLSLISLISLSLSLSCDSRRYGIRLPQQH